MPVDLKEQQATKLSEPSELEPSAKQRLPKKKPKSSVKRKRPKPKKREVKQPAGRRPYPRVSLESALRVPTALKEKNGGNPWPPADVATAVGLSHKNPDFFYLAAASRDFGFTEGSRDSEQISLTDFGRDVVYPSSKAEEQTKLREALLKVDIFKQVLDYYKGSNLPEMQYLGNTLERQFHLNPAFHEEFSRLFRENCAFLQIGSGFSPDQKDTQGGRQPGSELPRDGRRLLRLNHAGGRGGLKPTFLGETEDHSSAPTCIPERRERRRGQGGSAPRAAWMP